MYKVMACRYKVDFSEMTSIDDDEDEFYGSDDDSGESRISSLRCLMTSLTPTLCQIH